MNKLIAYFLFMVSVACASESIDQIIAETGSFVYLDGSSYFAFGKSGQFESGPKGMSGRTIKGTWSKDRNDMFVIKGQWSWMNGWSQTNDFRTMVIYISYHNESYLAPSNSLFYTSIQTNRPIRLYTVYATIDSLTKDTNEQPQQSGPAYPPQSVGSADP